MRRQSPHTSAQSAAMQHADTLFDMRIQLPIHPTRNASSAHYVADADANGGCVLVFAIVIAW